MKKVLSVTLLVALCCAVVFAADATATIGFGVSVNEKGVNLENSKIGFGFNISGDKAGGGFGVYLEKGGITIDPNAWVKPTTDNKKYTLGAKTKLEFDNNYQASEVLYYGMIENSDLFAKRNNPNVKVPAKFVVAYLSDLNGTHNGSSFLTGAQLEYKTMADKIKNLHLDTWFDYAIEGKRVEIKRAYGELTYGNMNNTNKALFNGFNSGSNIEKGFNNPTWIELEPKSIGDNSQQSYRLGLQYCFDKNAEKEDNGLFFYGFLHNHMLSAISETQKVYVRGEAKVGFYKADLDFGLDVREVIVDDDSSDTLYSLLYSYLDTTIDWVNGPVEARINNAHANFYKSLPKELVEADGGKTSIIRMLKLNLDYVNEKANTADKNGVFFKTTISQDAVGICNNPYFGARIGVDKNDAFHWEVLTGIGSLNF